MDTNGNKKRAAIELMCTIRNINRMIAGYKSKGKEYFIHGNKYRINLTLAILTERKIDAGHSVRFDKKYYRLMDCNGYPVYYHKGTKCMVIQAFDK